MTQRKKIYIALNIVLWFAVIFFVVSMCSKPTPSTRTEATTTIEVYKDQDGKYKSNLDFPVDRWPQTVIVDSSNFWKPSEGVPPIPPDTIPPKPPITDFDFEVDTESELIQAAAEAKTGDTVGIHGGTYRLTVTPANNGVVFMAVPNEAPVISGANPVTTPWVAHSGNIFKTTVTINGGNLFIDNNNTNTTLMAIQIFKGGKMQMLARWPKVPDVAALFQRSFLRQRNQTQSWAGGRIDDNGIPNIAGGWNGGRLWLTGWYISSTKNITSHSGSTITFSNYNNDTRFEQYYYLTGKLGALTTAGEWHYENNTLYFWQPGGGVPTDVEYKVRNWGFDVRGKRDTKIIGLHFFACDPILSDVNSTATIVDGIRAKYINHTFLLTGGGDLYTNARRTGLMIIGENSVLKNSQIQYSASQAVWLGEKCRMENNLILDINYEGNYAAGVNFWNPNKAGTQKILWNTFTRNGRSAIDFSEYEGRFPNGTQVHRNMEIAYNDISESLMLSADGGQTYGSVYTDVTGIRIHHNWIHDSKAQATPTAKDVVGLAAGIYWDQATGPSCIDHNVLWNNYQTDIHTQQNGLPKRHAGKSWLIGNTFATGPMDTYNTNVSYLTITTDVWDYQRNNVYIDNVHINWVEASPTWGDVKNSIQRGNNPQFVGGSSLPVPAVISAPQDYFQLASNSPGKNTGTAIPSSEKIPNVPDNAVFTAGAVGVVDIGAYELGGEKWIPGYNGSYTPEPPRPPATGTVEDNAPDTKYSHDKITFTNSVFSGGSASYMTVDGSTITVEFTGTGAEWWTEKAQNHGKVKVFLDEVLKTTVDLYAAGVTTNNSQKVYGVTGLTNGKHKIVLQLSGKNPSSLEANIIHDAIKVLPAAGQQSLKWFHYLAGIILLLIVIAVVFYSLKRMGIIKR